MHESLTQFAGAERILWRLLEAKGIDPGPIYARAGIDASLLREQRTRVGVRQVDLVWREALTLLDAPCIAIEFPKYWRPGDFSALDHAWLAASTLERALRALVRYMEIVDQSGRLFLERHDDGLALCGAPSRFGLKDYAVLREGFIAVITHMARLIAGTGLAPLEVTLRTPESVCTQSYERWFGCRVRFSAPSDCIRFHQRDLTRPLDAHPAVGIAIDRILSRELARLRTG